MGLFGSHLTPEERMAECQSMLRVQVRSLERSRDKLDERCEEYKDRAKDLAQDGKMQEAQMTVKQVIRFRGASLKLTGVVMKIEEMNTRYRFAIAA